MTSLAQSRLIAIFIFVFAISYNLVYFQLNYITAISEAIAGTAGYLFCLSFILTPISYFFNYLDSGLQLRKDLGVIALWLAFIYSLTLMARFPDNYLWGLPYNITNSEVILGLSGLSIMFIMRINGSKFGIKHIPRMLWRPIFRLGYLALIMFIIRAILVEGQIWSEFWNSQRLLPPPRLNLSIFATLTIISRFIMGLHQLAFKKPLPIQIQPNSQPAN